MTQDGPSLITADGSFILWLRRGWLPGRKTPNPAGPTGPTGPNVREHLTSAFRH